MKSNQLLLIASFLFISILSSCKKDNRVTDSDSVIESTYQLSTDNTTTDYLAEDDNEILLEAAEEKSLLGNFGPEPTTNQNFLACAAVTVTPLVGFPKLIVIRFDSTCTNSNGTRRSGVIRIAVSDSIRRAGSTSVMTFENYYVNNFKREGTHTFTNTSLPGTKSWQRKIEGGKITAPSGRFWLHQSIRNVVQTAGISTPIVLLDDVYSITGNGSITNSDGVTRTAAITQALQKKNYCPYIDKGTIRYEGPNHFAVLDYGNGDCDRFAVISIDGRTPRTILLP